jgi:hypothetical protein
MTDIVVSPILPRWVLDTFEGKFIEAWIGSRSKGGDFVEFDGDTEADDDENIILLEMSPSEVKELALLAEDAGTPICKQIARLLSDPEGTNVMNEYFGKIDISVIRCEVDIKDKDGKFRMLEVDDLLHSLVSRFPEQIPYAEVTWARGAAFITPSGIEWFKKESLLKDPQGAISGRKRIPGSQGLILEKGNAR